MKILIDGRLYGLENAGLGRYVMNLVSELSKLDSSDKFIILLTKKYFNELELPQNWKKVLADFKHYTFAEQVKLPSLVEKENPDITHFPHFNVPLTFSGNYVVTIHDLLMHKGGGPSTTTLIPPLYFIKRLGYKIIFRKAVMGAKSIIVPSNTIKKEVVDYYHVDTEKVKVIYEGVDEKIQSNGKNILEKFGIKNPYFIYTGNAYPHKNLERAIEAVISLNKESGQKVLFLIASARNIFTKRLQKLIDKFKATETVKLLGFVPDDELGSLFAGSLGFVFPSISEGFGLPGLEAMSAGTVLLASDIPVFKEIYKDHALYFNPFDFTSIQKVLKSAIELDQDKRKELIESGKNFVDQYSWEKMAKETLSVYRSSK